MVKSILVFVVTLVAFCFPATLSAAPLEAYGRLPAIQDIAISADGDVIAVLWTNGTERRITINDLKSDEINTLGLGPAKIRDIVWADSQHLLITSSTTATIPWVEAPRSEYALLYLYDRKINKIKSLMKDSGEGLNIIIGLPDIPALTASAAEDSTAIAPAGDIFVSLPASAANGNSDHDVPF